jgi:hypothetical protein
MTVDLSAKLRRAARSLRTRAHAIGFLGANLTVGAVAAWTLTLIRDLQDGTEWSPLRLLAPWSQPEPELSMSAFGLTGVALVAFLAGIALMASAARELSEAEEREDADF